MVSNQKTKKLPFEVGQLAESKSFSQGFRGAWFRCKIMKIKMKKGDVIYDMDFYDFTDDKPSETKLYQIKEKKLHMMVRPRFPPIYRETQMPDTSAISEVIAVVDDIWNVGDLVDWWYDDCYWTGRITHQLGQDKVQIQLLEQPMGEGGSYKALCKDLRPSLDWSLQHGWTVPISSDGEARQCCVRLVHPSSLIIHKKPSQEGKSVKSHATSVSSHGSADASVSAKISSPLSKGTPKQLSDCGLVEKIERLCVIKGLDLGDDDPGKPSSSDNVSSTHVQRVSAASENSTGSKGPHTYGRPSKKTRLMEEDYWNSSDPIESSIIDLEELVNKIKWLKRAHQFGFACASAMTPPWKFLEDQPSFRHA